jgi:integrase
MSGKFRIPSCRLDYRHGGYVLCFTGLPEGTEKPNGKRVTADGRAVIALGLKDERRDKISAEMAYTTTQNELRLGTPFTDLAIFGAARGAVPVQSSGITLGELLDGYVEDRNAHEMVEESTLYIRRQHWSRMFPLLGGRDRVAASVSSQDIIDVITRLRRDPNQWGRKNGTAYVRQCMYSVRAAWQWGASRGKLKGTNGHALLCPVNDATVLEYLKPSKQERREAAKLDKTARSFTPQQQADYLAAVRARYSFREYVLWRCAFATGARLGELRAVELADFDFTAGHVTFHQTAARDLDGAAKVSQQRKNTTDVSVRLGLDPTFLAEIQPFIEGRRAENETMGWTTTRAFVQDNGSEYGYSVLRDHFQAVCLDAGLGDRSPHDTRHTFAVRLLESARGDVQSVLRFVASQLGDSVEMVVKTYLNGGYSGDNVAAFDGALAPAPSRLAQTPTAARPAKARLAVVK